MARTGACGLAQLIENAQLLPTGVPVITAPTLAEQAQATLATQIGVVAPPGMPPDRDVVVIADCGTAHPNSAARPIMEGSDALIVLVRTDLADPGSAKRQIAEIAGWAARCRAVLLVGSDQAGEFAAELGVPVMGRLPRDARGASAILQGDKVGRRRGTLAAAAREIATALRAQLVADQPASSLRPPGRCDESRARQWWQACLPRGDAAPSVYRLQRHILNQHAPAVADNSRALAHSGGGEEASASDVELEITAASHASLVNHPSDTAPTRPQTPTPLKDSDLAGATLAVNVLGPLRVIWHDPADSGGGVDITARLQPRSRELLTLLAVHPDGVTRDALIDSLWGEHIPARPTNAITTAMSRLRAALNAATDGAAANVIVDGRIRYRLDPATVTVDYWQFSEAVDSRRRATTDEARAACYHRIVTLAGGALAQDLHTDWIEPIRVAAHRDAVNALAALARILVADSPRRTLDLLEAAIVRDPHNELIYRDILRLHARLGEHDAIDRTMALLTRRLTEIGEQPTTETQQLAERLRHAKND
ncbi:AfsR/SARP family transcriptional regulator [Nocardia nepalensis]|uniref:AfsR/SARP family transcriptional regulator n=1 Tax=Nocardia nepalensis TaxID=3375448 RepID=UPI003B677B0A